MIHATLVAIAVYLAVLAAMNFATICADGFYEFLRRSFKFSSEERTHWLIAAIIFAPLIILGALAQ